MRLKPLIIACATALPLGAAAAQPTGSSRADAALKIYDWCIDVVGGDPVECGCASGFYAGATDDDEFQLVAEAVTFFDANGGISDTEAVFVALQALKEDMQMTDERYQAIVVGFQNFGALGEKSDAICVPVRDAASFDAEQ